MEILLICNFHPSRARNFATTIISKLNNFAEVLAVHVEVYMATPVLRSLTHETLCDTGQRTADTSKFTYHHLPITKSLHFKPSILVFFCGFAAKNHRWKKLKFVPDMIELTKRSSSKLHHLLEHFLLFHIPPRHKLLKLSLQLIHITS